MKSVTTEQEKTEPFTLKLPDRFSPTPEHTVDLPAKHKALIFETKIRRYDYDDDGKKSSVEEDGWDVLIVNRHGVAPRNYNFREQLKTADAIEVQQYLRNAARELSKVKRTKAMELDHDED